MSSHALDACSLGVQLVQQNRIIAQLQTTIADFDRQADSLDCDIRIEEDRVNNYDPSHFAYPTYAKAATQRRDNLRRSSRELKDQLDVAKKALSEAELEAARLLDTTPEAQSVVASNLNSHTPGRPWVIADNFGAAQDHVEAAAHIARQQWVSNCERNRACDFPWRRIDVLTGT